METRMEDALKVGQHTLESLRTAQMKLENVQKWEMRERFGGNVFISIIKNMKISDMQEYIIQAKRDVLKFQIVLKSICMPEEIKKVTRVSFESGSKECPGTGRRCDWACGKSLLRIGKWYATQKCVKNKGDEIYEKK